ncbi:MAG: hypothetical protein RI580_07915 [Halothece sp. Uz-M2-17]|nr:hypothetical protein [Halothece sp. Uz-M2-17]
MSNALMSDAPTGSESKSPQNAHVGKIKQSLMQADQQAKFLHLQAEVESLWQQVKRSQLDDE